MSQKPRVTIGLPTLNGSATLARALDSLQAQTYEDFRVVVSNNASTDRTAELCEEYCRRDSRFFHHRHEARIPGQINWQWAMEQTGTPYFMWLGDDDHLSPDFLAGTVEYLDAEPGCGAVTGVSVYRTDNPSDPAIWTVPRGQIAVKAEDRLTQYIEFLTDNSELYSLCRVESVKGLEFLDVHGWDWILMGDIVWRTPLAVLPHWTVHRRDQWRRPQRHAEVVGAKKLQGENPHLTTAVRHFLHVAAMGRQYEGLGAARRVELAWRLYGKYVRTKINVPEKLDFTDAVKKLVPETMEAGGLMKLAAALREAAEEEGSGPLLAEVFDGFDLWKLGSGTNGRPLIETGMRGVVAATLDGHVADRFRRLPLASYNGQELTVALRSAAATKEFFFTAAEHEEFVEFQMQTLMDLSAMSGADVALNGPRQSGPFLLALNRYLQALNLIPVFQTEENLRPYMEARGNLTEILLRSTGHALDCRFPSQTARTRQRVGVLMTTLASHTDAYTTMPAVEHLDRSRYEVIVLSLYPFQAGASKGEMHFRSLADRLVHLTGSLKEKVQMIRSAGLDYLLIGSNITAVTNELFLIAAHKLAPCQVALNPCCVTTGLRSVDFYLSGRLCEPGAAQEHYRERLYLADGPAHVRARVAGDQAAPAPVARGGGPVTFVSTANFYKMMPEVRRTWLEILSRTSGSRLWLMPFGPAWSDRYEKAKLLAAFAEEARELDVDPGRIELADTFDTVDRLRQAMMQGDVYLDSFPFAGLNSLMDALECGLPAVVRAGNSFRSMMGESLMRCLELPELVAGSRDEYVRLAVKLAGDTERRRGLEATIRERMAAGPRFYDARWYSRQFADLFEMQPAQAGAGAALQSR